jgi:hypothetical protein
MKIIIHARYVNNFLNEVKFNILKLNGVILKKKLIISNICMCL